MSGRTKNPPRPMTDAEREYAERVRHSIVMPELAFTATPAQHRVAKELLAYAERLPSSSDVPEVQFRLRVAARADRLRDAVVALAAGVMAKTGMGLDGELRSNLVLEAEALLAAVELVARDREIAREISDEEAKQFLAEIGKEDTPAPARGFDAEGRPLVERRLELVNDEPGGDAPEEAPE